MVAHIKQARQHRYRPLVAADDVESGVVHSLLSRVFSGSAHRLVARLLESAPIDPGELESIRELIDRREAELAATEGDSK